MSDTRSVISNLAANGLAFGLGLGLGWLRNHLARGSPLQGGKPRQGGPALPSAVDRRQAMTRGARGWFGWIIGG